MASRRRGLRCAAGAVLISFTPAQLWACATCFGKSDSALAAGLNWGIGSLLAVVTLVLGGIAAFFVHVARRAAAGEALEPPGASEAEIAPPSAPQETTLIHP